MTENVVLAHSQTPWIQLLGNSRYALMVAGGGTIGARWRGKAVNRWLPGTPVNAPADDVLVRDLDSGLFWSATAQAHGCDPEPVTAVMETGRVGFETEHDGVASALDISVAPDCDGDLRLLALHNHSRHLRHLEIVSVMELVLGAADADASHPAFSKMFVQTEALGEGRVLLARRRRRSSEEDDIWAASTCHIESTEVEAIGFETDRARLLGRSRGLDDPALFDADAPLLGDSGTVLDPVFCLRRRFTLQPGARVQCSFWTTVGDERKDVLEATRRCVHTDAQHALREAAATARNQLGRLGLDEARAERAQCLVSPLLQADAAWRAPAGQLERGRGGQSTLWPRGISGDRPILLAHLSEAAHLDLARELLDAQRFWLARQLGVDMVFVHAPAQADALNGLIGKHGPDKSAGAAAFALAAGTLDDAEQAGLATAARIMLDGNDGNLAAQIHRRRNTATPLIAPRGDPVADTDAQTSAPTHELQFDNGYGGFSADGREYIVQLRDRRSTPAPWINVVANAGFGFIASAEGGGYSWSINSQQNQITPWCNDAVRDPPVEIIYLGDLDNGAVWTVTASPIRDGGPYTVAHGQGYTRYRHMAHGIDAELVLFVAGDDPVKLSHLKVYNRTGRTRTLTVTAFVEWALGAIGKDSRSSVVSHHDAETGALFACNSWREPFADRVAFLDMSGRQRAWTCDRAEFIGPRGNTACPAALEVDARLFARDGAGLDPCAVQQTRIELAPGAMAGLTILLGETDNEALARQLIRRYRDADAGALLKEFVACWEEMFDSLQVTTPEPSADILVNRWLPYQVLSCRVWARTAFYQSSGAFGFRDQLQDVMAFCLSRPDLAREHILRAASRQFPEGDVQHWWLPPKGAGVRTRIVDDRLWLPYAAAHYITVTADIAVLDEDIAFLDGAKLKDGQIDNFFTPTASTQSGTLFEHCARAIDVSLVNGDHGLPLFGSGDWNDGMNRVGKDGKGESVWMAWFLHAAISAMMPLAMNRGEHRRAARWQQWADALIEAAETHAWDGGWWRRGWYDDGHTLGSAADDECHIDTIAQSWSVLARAANRERATQAMAAVDRMAVDRDARLIALFTPAFDHGPRDPGYIKGYPPGLRENGGQYTHGVIWSAIAFAELGDGDKAGELLAMLNPVSHADSTAAIERYKVEPYVSCADVYTAEGHVGRGGWTWYSGSAGWLYRAIVEWQLGLRVSGNVLRIRPCIPHDWPGYDIRLRHRSSRYIIHVDNPNRVCSGVTGVELDGKRQTNPQAAIALADDRSSHHIHIRLGESD